MGRRAALLQHLEALGHRRRRAAQLALPACEALIVQVPTAARVTVPPETLHTAAVVEAKVTARPEVAVALTGKGAVPNT